MVCRGCGGVAEETSYGPWCVACGGVMYGPGEPYVRHVATARGHGGEFKILFDHSLSSYSFAVTRNIKTWVEIKGEFVQAQRTFTHTGTLDVVIAMVQPLARGDSQEFPSLEAGPGANDEERLSIEETFGTVTPPASVVTLPRLESLKIDG